jgi:hypothetical protein
LRHELLLFMNLIDFQIFWGVGRFITHQILFGLEFLTDGKYAE